MTETWDESFEDDPCLVSKHIWVAVSRYDKNAANTLLHLMKMIMEGHSHNFKSTVDREDSNPVKRINDVLKCWKLALWEQDVN